MCVNPAFFDTPMSYVEVLNLLLVSEAGNCNVADLSGPSLTARGSAVPVAEPKTHCGGAAAGQDPDPLQRLRGGRRRPGL